MTTPFRTGCAVSLSIDGNQMQVGGLSERIMGEKFVTNKQSLISADEVNNKDQQQQFTIGDATGREADAAYQRHRRQQRNALAAAANAFNISSLSCSGLTYKHLLGLGSGHIKIEHRQREHHQPITTAYAADRIALNMSGHGVLATKPGEIPNPASKSTSSSSSGRPGSLRLRLEPVTLNFHHRSPERVSASSRSTIEQVSSCRSRLRHVLHQHQKPEVLVTADQTLERTASMDDLTQLLQRLQSRPSSDVSKVGRGEPEAQSSSAAREQFDDLIESGKPAGAAKTTLVRTASMNCLAVEQSVRDRRENYKPSKYSGLKRIQMTSRNNNDGVESNSKSSAGHVSSGSTSDSILKSGSDFPDPLRGASSAFVRRLNEMALLESRTKVAERQIARTMTTASNGFPPVTSSMLHTSSVFRTSRSTVV